MMNLFKKIATPLICIIVAAAISFFYLVYGIGLVSEQGGIGLTGLCSWLVISALLFGIVWGVIKSNKELSKNLFVALIGLTSLSGLSSLISAFVNFGSFVDFEAYMAGIYMILSGFASLALFCVGVSYILGKFVFKKASKIFSTIFTIAAIVSAACGATSLVFAILAMAVDGFYFYVLFLALIATALPVFIVIASLLVDDQNCDSCEKAA